MTHTTDNAWQHPEVQLAGGGYIVAYLAGLALMGLSLWIVREHTLAPMDIGIAISLVAGLAALVQCVLLLHLNISETQIWHTVALILFIPLFILAVGLSAWMFHGLYRRTMLMPATHVSVPAGGAQASGTTSAPG
ncbi:MAG: cytochrome O ubiquinol oxidase [Gammaproteobacteria bacterium]|nr:cytochrome O ubiquinol oxidase [Gammaproteobacteria bacterium]